MFYPLNNSKLLHIVIYYKTKLRECTVGTGLAPSIVPNAPLPGFKGCPLLNFLYEGGGQSNYEWLSKVSPLTTPSTKPDTMLTIKLFQVPEQRILTLKEVPYVR